MTSEQRLKITKLVVTLICLTLSFTGIGLMAALPKLFPTTVDVTKDYQECINNYQYAFCLASTNTSAQFCLGVAGNLSLCTGTLIYNPNTVILSKQLEVLFLVAFCLMMIFGGTAILVQISNKRSSRHPITELGPFLVSLISPIVSYYMSRHHVCNLYEAYGLSQYYEGPSSGTFLGFLIIPMLIVLAGLIKYSEFYRLKIYRNHWWGLWCVGLEKKESIISV